MSTHNKLISLTFESRKVSPAALVVVLFRKRMAATELSKSMNEFLTKLQDDLKEAMNTMMCTKCEGKHKYVATLKISRCLGSICQHETLKII